MSRFGVKLKEVVTLSGSIVAVTIHIERADKKTQEIVEMNCWRYIGTANKWLMYSELERPGGAMIRVEARLPPGDPVLTDAPVAPESNHYDMCNKFSKVHLLQSELRTWLK